MEQIIEMYWSTLFAIAFVSLAYYLASLGSRARVRVKVRINRNKGSQGQSRASKDDQ